ncbi:Fe-S protein assembly co-chaperone HscB [Neptunomonas marina]|uniref:Co-chaperone protein HscB homolog n=1 Tax=Neptunomonas marina TaxID=1815562 RepID=A0A437Q6K5_9GAMM|nr:Fe-S protein assembly co-chaperone HscB [Neptunomonas marina]RVU30140.1 Fe-S protein assembly co-chaperone HscB [Neptunomonas marina]
MDIQQNYFAFLGVSEAFDIDLSYVSERYRDLQKQLHPDKFAHASDREQRMAVQYTAYLNEAMATLKSPLLRAQYLLTLKGIDTHSEASVSIDPAFLFEQMELRETLESAKASDDPFDVLESLSDRVEVQLRTLESAFKSAYARGDDTSLEDAAAAVRKMQFLTKLSSEIAQAEHDLDG